MKKIWSCKIGETNPSKVKAGDDGVMRQAVAEAYFRITGEHPEFCFSGWNAELTEPERAVVEDRLPSDQYEAAWKAGYAAAEEKLKNAEG